MKRNIKACSLLVCFALCVGSSAVSAQENNADSLNVEPASSIQVQTVNINNADAETIAEILDGIGQSKAEAIVKYREDNGPFASVEELAEVKGVGEKTLARNEARIRLE